MQRGNCLTAILLGAGASKRMGKNKLLLPWGKKTILQHCLDTLLRTEVKEVILVVNDETEPIACQNRNRRIKVVLNPHYREGMSRSIQQGIEASNPNCKGFLIALGDQPSIPPRTINVLIKAFHEHKGKIILPSFKGMWGHPVIFPQSYKAELLRLKGDEGGRTILKRYPEMVYAVPVKAHGVVRDIDTPKDYKKELKMRQRTIRPKKKERLL